ncbi:Uncharacterised protein [Serratia rubidaea]|uniref:Uncharacterized protein n=1 Tax=Serratia rubidaea TaxID=61652 RepID=A0A3S4GPR8_SERRU|nr:Uncharacterised protein [Serratia rubidaea]
MVDRVKPAGDADHHGDDRQGVKKRREHRRRQTERQRQQHLGADIQQQLGKHEQQQLLHKVDAGHHKDQQQQHFEIIGDFFTDVRRAGHADGDRLQRQQAAGLQRVALKRHRQGEDKFRHQQPAGGEGAYQEKDQRINRQKYQDG